MPPISGSNSRTLIQTAFAFPHHRVQQILEPDAPEHLSPHAIRDTVDDFGPVLGRIDVHAKRSSAEGCIDHL